MMNSEAAEILYELEAGGHRLTRLREAVIDILSSRNCPLLIEELGRALNDRLIKIHRTTLMRELDFLENRGIVVPVILDDRKIRYEFAERDHHHHAICTRCKRIEDVEIDEDKLKIDNLLKDKSNFQITRHTLEFFGVCGECK